MTTEKHGTAMDGISALPEHLQHEVFSRVGDVKSLFRFAATCRGWLCRFFDPAFLRELCPGQLGSGSGPGHHHRARLLGLFAQDSWKWFNRWNRTHFAPVFLPALGSPLGPAGRALTSFVGIGQDNDDGTFDYAEPVAVRRGIVLLRLARRTPERDYHLFSACNPITGDCHVLPPLKRWLAGGKANGFAIITAADGQSDSDHPPAVAARFAFSQLIVITQHGNLKAVGLYLHLHSYSAATRHWQSAPTRCLQEIRCSLVGARSAVVHRGAAHWLCVDRGHHLCRLSVDVPTTRVSLTRLPVRVGGEQLLFVNNDSKLAVASVYPMHVTVWTPPASVAGDNDDDDDDDDDDNDRTTPSAVALWPRTSFRIPAAVPYPHIDPDQERCFNFNHGSLLALFRGSGVFVLDLDTMVMEKVFILGFDNKAMGFLGILAAFGPEQYLTCVPYEMDLVEFFTLQLGGIRERLGTN